MNNNGHYSHDEAAARIKQFITKELLYEVENAAIDNDTKLIEQGVVDSMGIFRLIAFLEEAFGVGIEPDAVVLENFETINAVAALITHSHPAQA
ncbi:MAG: acyl carrier protein [Chloroflexota bacterium]